MLRPPFLALDAVAADDCAEVGWSIERLVDRIAVVGRVAAERAREIATGVLVTAGQTPRKSAERVVALVGGGHP